MRCLYATSLFALSLLAPALAAQSYCHVENDGPTHGQINSGGSLTGVRFVASADFDCLGVEVFTGQGQGTVTVAIWSHDIAANKPDEQLGIGAWSMVNTLSWQGASLANAVPLMAGRVYWMVYDPIGASRASVDQPTPSPNQMVRYSSNGGQTWGQIWQLYDWKFRLYGDCDGIGNTVCFGDGIYAPCPCSNVDASGEAGCANSAGSGCRLTGAGSNSVSAADLVLLAEAALPNQPGIFFQGADLIGDGSGVPFGDGLRCAHMSVVRLELVVPDAGGLAASTVDVATTGAVGAGDLRHYQFWYRDPGGSPCGNGFNLSNALSIPWSP